MHDITKVSEIPISLLLPKSIQTNNNKEIREGSKNPMKLHSKSIPQFKSIRLVLGLAIIGAAVAFDPSGYLQRTSHRHRNSESVSFVSALFQGSKQQSEDDYRASYPPRNLLFDTNNVIVKHMPVANDNTSFIRNISPEPPKLWDRIMLRSINERGKTGVDVTVEFRDAKQGAISLVQQCLLHSNTNDHNIVDMNDGEVAEVENYISDALTFFQEHIQQNNGLYKARLVSTLGSDGQKCPRWHVDHVPLRLVMSLVGPGCIYVPVKNEVDHPFRVDRNALNELDEDDTTLANKLIMPRGEKDVAVCADKGDAVLLMGRAWEEYRSNHETGIDSLAYAAPHRSPTLGKDQLRVLLVADFLPDSSVSTQEFI
jgi:hypothetical protein